MPNILNLAGHHLLLSMNPDGKLKVTADDQLTVVLCSFELLRGLCEPVR
jgi:hypothetical protein